MSDRLIGQPDLDAAVQRLLAVPDEHRRFTVTGLQARQQHRVPADIQEGLLAAGLPFRAGPAGPLFDHHDLVNVSLETGLPSAQTLGMQHWSEQLLRPPTGETDAWDIRYSFSCPERGHPGPCRVEFLTPDAGRLHEELDRPRPMHKLRHVSRVQLRRRWPALRPQMRALVAEAAHWSFAVLPRDLAQDPGFTLRTGLADCTMGARLLVEEAGRRGIPARFAMGLAVVRPFSLRHCWAEFQVDGQWVPCDPVMVNALVRWKLLDESWIPDASIGSVLARLAGDNVAQAKHNGDYLRALMPTSPVDHPATAAG